MKFMKIVQLTRPVFEADETGGVNPAVPPIPPLPSEKPEAGAGQDADVKKDDNNIENMTGTPEDEKKLAEKRNKEVAKKKQEKLIARYKELRSELIDMYMKENRDVSTIWLRPVKDSYRAIVPIFNIDVSTDPYLDKEIFKRKQVLRKMNDELEYNDLFVKDIEHMAGKIGIDSIEWKKDSEGSKYFEIVVK